MIGQPSPCAQHWQLWPVVSPLSPGHPLGAVLVDPLLPGSACADPFPATAFAEDPAGALDWAAQALHLALQRLDAVETLPWLAVPLPAAALPALRGLLRRLARLGDTADCDDLDARLTRAGQRLVLLLPQGHASMTLDTQLLAGLGARHGLAELWHQVRPSAFQAVRQPFLSRVLVAPSLVAGIDSDRRLQGQWCFLVDGLRALQLPLVALGVQPGSELAWLSRHGCEQVAGPPFVEPESLVAPVSEPAVMPAGSEAA